MTVGTAGVVVRLAGLTFNSGPDADDDEFYISDIVGWDGPDVDLVTVDRPLSDGAVVVYGRLAAWTIVISGWVVAGPDGIGPARRKLTGALYGLVDSPDDLEADEDDGITSVTVYLASDVRTRQQGPSAISFEATFVAADPVKTYGGS